MRNHSVSKSPFTSCLTAFKHIRIVKQSATVNENEIMKHAAIPGEPYVYKKPSKLKRLIRFFSKKKNKQKGGTIHFPLNKRQRRSSLAARILAR